jgi:hypothetical protein
MTTDAATLDLSAIEGMSEEDIDALAAKLGLGDNEPDAEGEPAPTGEGEPSSAVGGGADPKPQGDAAEQPKLTGQELLESLKGSPEAQALIQQQLDGWLQSAAATAAAKKQQDEFNQLIKDGDYETIGKRFVQNTEEQRVREAAAEEASVKAYGEIYRGLLAQPEMNDLTAEEKVKLDSANFATDAEYVLAITDHIAGRRGSKSDDTRVNALVEERLTTLSNMKAAATATSGSAAAALPAGQVGQAVPTTSRSMIMEGYRELMEERADNRVAS